MSWSEALWKFSSRPQDFPNEVIKWNAKYVAILDGFPKSKIHLLILPRVKINGLRVLTPNDANMILEMGSFTNEVLSEMKLDSDDLKIGFHAIPSMKQLHLHVISKDFQGRGLKNKKHYNSFVTDFFLDMNFVLGRLSAGTLNVFCIFLTLVG